MTLAAVGAAALAGCVERTVSVTSEPVGALVYLNDQEVGRTPVTVPFTFYGVYDVRITEDGYEPLLTQATAATPWWDYPGPDLLAETIPGAKSQVRWHFALTPKAPDNPDALLQRAKELGAVTTQPAGD